MNPEQKYRSKAQDSFKTKLTMYIFNKVINNALNTIDLNDFNDFEIDKDLVGKYTTVYWQQETTEVINEISIGDIESAIKQWNDGNKPLIEQFKHHYVEIIFPTKFPMDKFENLINKNECHFCHITTDKIEQLANKQQLHKKSLRGWSLEIDRHDSNFEYTEKNYVMACYWCNNAKTDEFTSEEFVPIGLEIEKIWNKRLQR